MAQIIKSSRHSKITGDFAEHLVLYWLSKHGFECARVDHTGIDLIARNPHTHEVMGISVKSRSRNPGTKTTSISIHTLDVQKAIMACDAFRCKTYFAIAADIKKVFYPHGKFVHDIARRVTRKCDTPKSRKSVTFVTFEF